MADIDYQKDKVNFWRMLFFMILTTIFALVAFIFNNYETLNTFKLITVNVVTFMLVLILILISLKMSKEMEKLKDL